MNKASHQANVVKIQEVLPHNNADTLELIHIGGYQCVVKKGSFKPGDLAVYIQPDSVVPQTEPFRFIWEQYAQGPNACPHQRTTEHEFLDGQARELCLHCNVLLPVAVPERKRRITVRKFRGEWSEGLLLPLFDFGLIGCHTYKAEPPEEVNEGDDVSDRLGITHYDPDQGREAQGQNAHGPVRSRKYPRSFKGWFFFLLHKIIRRGGTYGQNEVAPLELPVYDVDAYKNFKGALELYEQVIITEKIHGSNARFVFLDGKMYAGSRNFWKGPTSNCIWRKALKQNPWIEVWCRAHEGYALYGEVVPTQKGFNYGCKEGEVKFFLFDVRSPQGKWLERTGYTDDGVYVTYQDGMLVPISVHVPLLMIGAFRPETIEEHSLVDGPSHVPGAGHIREGIVIKALKERHVRGLGRLQLKIVSNKFLEKDSK